MNLLSYRNLSLVFQMTLEKTTSNVCGRKVLKFASNHGEMLNYNLKYNGQLNKFFIKINEDL